MKSKILKLLTPSPARFQIFTQFNTHKGRDLGGPLLVTVSHFHEVVCDRSPKATQIAYQRVLAATLPAVSAAVEKEP